MSPRLRRLSGRPGARRQGGGLFVVQDVDVLRIQPVPRLIASASHVTTAALSAKCLESNLSTHKHDTKELLYSAKLISCSG